MLLTQGRLDEARDQLDLALPELDGIERIEAELDRGRSLARDHGEQALATYERVEAAARDLGRDDLVAAASSEAATMYTRTGRPQQALPLHERALALAPDAAAASVYRQRLAATLNLLGRNAEALAALAEVVAFHRAAGNPSGEAFALSAMANALTFEGRRDEAIAAYQAAYALQRRVGNRGSQGALLANWATALHHLRRDDEALAQLGEAHAIAVETGDQRFQGVALRAMASIHTMHGRLEEATRALDQAEVHLRRIRDPLWLGHVDALRTRILRYLGDHAGAEVAAERAVAAYRSVEVRTELADGLMQRVRLTVARGGDPGADAEEIRALAAGAPAGSMLDQTVRGLEELLAAVAAGEVLLAGERHQDLPEGLLARLGGSGR